MKKTIFIKPNSTKGPLVVETSDGTLIVYVREPAVDGLANEAVVKILAEHFKVPKTGVQIVRGGTSRYKVVEIDA